MKSQKKLLMMALSVSVFCATVTGAPGARAQGTIVAEGKAAMALYTGKQYAAAADAFEKIIAKQPSASYCYYAALSNRAARRESRARQLFEYTVHNFPGTVEANYSQQVIGGSGAASVPNQTANVKPSGDDELPDSVKSLIPPEMQALMSTPEGKRAIAEAMHEHSDKLKDIKAAEKTGALTPTKVAAAHLGIAVQKQSTVERGSSNDRNFPFTAADIAKNGAAAIDQTRYPNCWFECSMAALAELPRGQRLIASMIRNGQDKDTYVVRFPGDGHEYKISMEDLQRAKVHDSALWASLIECAQTRKFPDNEGAEGSSGDLSRLAVGLGCITGAKAEVIDDLASSSESQLSSFIGSAVKSQNPVVCGTNFGWKFPRGPILAIPLHAYTVIGFDPAHSMITIRNPHGQNSQQFALPGDPNHLDFEQLDDGVFKMSIRTFQKYFYSVCRSYI